MKQKISFLTAFIWAFASIASAQTSQPEMADILRANGKIYVVVAVILIIFFGIIAFLVYLERKLSRLER